MGTSRRGFLKRSGAAGLGFAFSGSMVEAAAEFDLVIRGGQIADGMGGPLWRADIGVVGDTIVEIGSIPAERAKRALDASGLDVSPGFIDIHTHSDSSIFRYPTADSRVHQGITTEVTGNCGYSAAPLEGNGAEELRSEMQEEYEIEPKWTNVESYLESLEKLRISVNHALLLGQGSLREAVVGMEDRSLADDELRSVIGALERGMDQGAFGLSTGLEYTPGAFTPTEEIVAMARVVARRGGLYASHIRNEEAALLAAINEAIHIGRQTGVRVEISHLKAAGRPNWDKQAAALDLIEAARRSGVQVLADAYPYTAYSTGLTIFVPTWALAGGRKELAKRLASATDRDRIRSEVARNVERDPGAFDLIVIASVKTEANQRLLGKNLVHIGETWSVEPVDALLRLLTEEDGSVGFIGHGMSPDNVERVLAHPLVMIGSDGYSIAPEGPAAKTRPHPRSYGTCARVLAHYTRERRLFDLPAAIKKMTSLPADQVGLRDRGRIARGMRADLVVFNAATVQDQATFDDPHRFARGLRHVVVNGVLVLQGGEHTGARPGRALRRM